jgi:hypothetical protein
MTGPSQSGALVGQSSGGVLAGHEPANLGDILERVLDRGIVIVGDIRVSLLDIELLTLKLRLVIASVDTAREMGIDWWEHDPWLTSRAHKALEAGRTPPEELEAREVEGEVEHRPRRSLRAAPQHDEERTADRRERHG